MKNTFHSETIKNESGEFLFNALALPDTDIFRIEINNEFGSNIEDLFQEMTGIDVHGASHLLEHMSFKSPRDYTSDGLLNKLKKYGERNATTSFDDLNYFYRTTMDHYAFAINAVVNIAYNDLSRVNEKEFNSERDVVLNEIKRYHDNKQMMFNIGMRAILEGKTKDNNILGSLDALQALSLDDLRKFKHLYNHYPKKVINIVYDPTKCDVNDLLELTMSEIRSMHTLKENIFDVENQYMLPNTIVSSGEYKAEWDPEQSMIGILFDITVNESVRSVGDVYLRELSENNSMFKKIRDEKGLTYGVGMGRYNVGDKRSTMFNVDVSVGNEDILLETLGEVLNACADEYTEEIHNDVLDTSRLKFTLRKTDLTIYEGLFYTTQKDRDIFEKIKDIVSVDATKMHEAKIDTMVTFDQVKNYLAGLKELFNNKDYILIKNKG